MEKKYNTTAKKLPLPEYGRHIQNMVDYCTQLEDRTERQKCAEAIVSTMSAFFQNQKDRSDFAQLLWDHLYIMSDFKLDIDFPFAVSDAKSYKEKPSKLSYTHQESPVYRHYGHSIEKMIELALKEEEKDKREAYEKITAVQMKRDYIAWNKDNVEDQRIFTDLYEMSKGEIYQDELSCLLPTPQQIQANLSNGTQNNGRRMIQKKKRK